jgi:glycosyltransferase involved in cell wall biosynthesis
VTLPERERPFRAGGLRTVHIIAGLDASYGGPSYIVPRFCQALVAAGVETTLLSVAEASASASSSSEAGYCDCRFGWDFASVPMLRELRASSNLVRALRDVAPRADVIHDHGLWLMPNLQAGRVAARVGKPLVVTPLGMLSPTALRFSQIRKQATWCLLQGRVMRRAACIHATCEQEYLEIRGLGLANPIAIIPNGIDLPEPQIKPIGNGGDERVVLSLGRIHPKKGLDRLLHCWARVEATHPDWRLRIIGPGEIGHDEQLRALVTELGLSRVSIEGPLYGGDKLAAYRDASLFVLPTLSDSFAMTVAESLGAGTPVISTKGAPWEGLETHGCGWWTDHGVEPLTAALDSAMSLSPGDLIEMGAKGRKWMAEKFSWDEVATQMQAVYQWLVHDGTPPTTIRLS